MSQTYHMRCIPFLLLLCLCAACTNRKYEQELSKRANELNQKEQQLLLREKQLDLREEQLSGRERKLDSVKIADTTAIYPDMFGNWAVTMSCIETTCAGSAVGDTKNEQWIIEQQNNHVLAKAMAGNKLVRSYSGAFNGNTLELSELRDSLSSLADTRMIVRLQWKDKKSMEGRREIIREKDCRIIYSLKLDRN